MSRPAPEVEWVDRIPSTMDLLHQRAADGAAAGTAIAAGEQTGGRGSRGRAWRSPLGGLWLSVLFRPRTPAGIELLSLRIGLAVARTLEELGVEPRVYLKWPNDLILEERKVGGILCEARWQGPAVGWVVAGLGLNVDNRVPPDFVASATALSRHRARRRLSPETLARPVVEVLRGIDPSAGPLTAGELSQYRERDWLRGKPLRAPVAGIVAGIGADGALLVHRPDGGTTAVRAGGVELAETAGKA